MTEFRDLSRPVDRAIWYVESHLDQELTLAEVAQISGVSRFHLTRAFGSATGMPIMRYVRARRLAKAAEELIGGERDILGLALGLGYGSHEAFSRAFRDYFGLSPSEVREGRGAGVLERQEALRMETLKVNDRNFEAPSEPRIETLGPLRIVGLRKTYGSEGNAGIPAQWQEFVPYLGSIPGQSGEETYGVCITDEDGKIDYISGVRVDEPASVPGGMDAVAVPQATYAVFDHKHHVSIIPSTWSWIWSEWFAGSGYEPLEGPSLEHYPVTFDGQTGEGGLEIWVPVKQR